VAQVQGVAAIDQQDVCFSNPTDPAFCIDAGQRGELQHAQGLPAQLAHGGFGFLSTNEPPCQIRSDMRVPVPRGGDTEGAALANRFAQQVYERVVDARVLDARRCEKILHTASPQEMNDHKAFRSFGVMPKLGHGEGFRPRR
jgi:hypothetical protein